VNAVVGSSEGTSDDKQVERFLADLTRLARRRLPEDQARDLVGDISDHITASRRDPSSGSVDHVLTRLGPPLAIVDAALGTTHAPSKIGGLSRVRTSTRVTAEATAFVLMFLGLSTAVYMARTFWYVDLLAPISYPLPLAFVVVGTGLMWASNKLILTEKCVALALTVASPIVAHYAFLHLPGHPQESCESGYSTDSHGHIFDRYDTCSHANWATQTVEALLIFVPVIVFVVFLFRARRRSTIETLGQPRPTDNRSQTEAV
jgi:hypothetical protein